MDRRSLKENLQNLLACWEASSSIPSMRISLSGTFNLLLRVVELKKELIVCARHLGGSALWYCSSLWGRPLFYRSLGSYHEPGERSLGYIECVLDGRRPICTSLRVSAWYLFEIGLNFEPEALILHLICS